MAVITIFIKFLFALSVYVETKFPKEFEMFRFFIQTVFSYFFINIFVNFVKFMNAISIDNQLTMIELLGNFATENRLGIILVLVFALFNRILVKRKEGLLLIFALITNIVLFLLGL